MFKKRPVGRESRQPLIQLALMLIFPIVAFGDDEGPVAWAFWDASDATSDIRLSHDSWNGFLSTYVAEVADGINRVNYAAVTAKSRQALQSYLDRMSALDPRELNRTEQLAYWINLYNALTVDVVLRHPGAKSIRDMGKSFFRAGPWRDELTNISGQALGLDDIEHRILRPIFRDRRIHFAVNCASIGCPNLMAIAYDGANVESLLNKAEEDYINHERAISFDSKGRLTLSSIFEWYAEDFAPDEGRLLVYLAGHHDLYRERLMNYTGNVQYGYDWSLNAVDKR